nr:hypothetical protein Q903MT_gene3305 [Picea sitchensis]
MLLLVLCSSFFATRSPLRSAHTDQSFFCALLVPTIQHYALYALIGSLRYAPYSFNLSISML